MARRRSADDPDGKIAERVGAAIRQARTTAHLTGKELGSRIGTRDQSVISDYERGETVPSIATLLLLDEALGLSRGTLLIAAGLLDPERITTDVRTALLATNRYDEGFRQALIGLVDYEERRIVYGEPGTGKTTAMVRLLEATIPVGRAASAGTTNPQNIQIEPDPRPNPPVSEESHS